LSVIAATACAGICTEPVGPNDVPASAVGFTEPTVSVAGGLGVVVRVAGVVVLRVMIPTL